MSAKKAVITLRVCSFLSVILLASTSSTAEDKVTVNILNFVEAKTSLQFDKVIARAGGINQWAHNRLPIPIDQQRLRRMNRDTIYSSVVVDISKGATLSLPDAGLRYMSATITNENNYINNIFHGAGDYQLDLPNFNTDFVMVTVRILVDSGDVADVREANRLQDQLKIISAGNGLYKHPNYAMESLEETAKPLIQLAAGLTDAKRAFGKEADVDPIKHVLASAYGWGGLPEKEAYTIRQKDVI